MLEEASALASAVVHVHTRSFHATLFEHVPTARTAVGAATGAESEQGEEAGQESRPSQKGLYHLIQGQSKKRSSHVWLNTASE